MFVSPRMLQLFLRVLKARHAIVGVFILLALAGTYGATQIPTDTSIDRLIVASDPVAAATREFERVFPEGEQALIVLEAPDPLSASALQSADQLERELGKIPNVAAHSLLTVYFRSNPPATISAADAESCAALPRAPCCSAARVDRGPLLRVGARAAGQFARGTRRALAAIDAKVLPSAPRASVHRDPACRLALARSLVGAAKRAHRRKVHAPVRRLSHDAGIIVYRSWRALVAIILTLGAVVAIAIGLGDVAGVNIDRVAVW